MWLFWFFLISSRFTTTGSEGIFTNSWEKCFNSPPLSNTDCTDESMENVPKDIFETPYNDIELSSNPYKCGCNMAWFLTRLRLKDYTQTILDLDEMRCNTPARLKGKLVYRLKEIDVCPQGGRAAIVNECKLGGHQCHKYAQCWDRKYGYDCTCTSGFTGDGRHCTDIDECKLTEQCEENSECMNTLGTFSCVCNQGYVKKNLDCEDIDECGDGTAVCHRHALCKNTPGSYQCACKRGYYGKNGQDCVLEDVTSCSSKPSPCRGLGEECIDGHYPGEYKCRCQTGFLRSKTGCQDIDECKTKIEACGSTAECINTEGSYKCVCPKGLSYHGRTCVDVNECAKGLDDCHSDAACVNNIGSFFCVCDVGFKELKEGRLCVKEDEDGGFNMVPIIVVLVVVLAVASFAFIFYMRAIRNRRKGIEDKPLVKGKQKKNWFSNLILPEANSYRIPVSESALTVWSDSDEE